MAFISSAKNSSEKENVNTASIPTASTNVSSASVNIGAFLQLLNLWLQHRQGLHRNLQILLPPIRHSVHVGDTTWELVFISSGKLLCQWELITASGNALCILFPTINPINRNGDGEGRTTVVRCKNNSSIQMSNGLATLEQEMETSAIKCKLWHLKKSTIIALGNVYKTDGKQMLHNKELLKDCYKVPIDTSLVDAVCI
nr:hypothetical protein [Tanacetum cinerariifolium]